MQISEYSFLLSTKGGKINHEYLTFHQASSGFFYFLLIFQVDHELIENTVYENFTFWRAVGFGQLYVFVEGDFNRNGR